MAAHAYIPFAFQFHYGSIRTQQRQMIEIDKHSRFNSIMVQLEHEEWWWPEAWYRCFNSIMVQLEQQIETKVPEFSSGFNSIKVQLEHLRVNTVFVLEADPKGLVSFLYRVS